MPDECLFTATALDGVNTALSNLDSDIAAFRSDYSSQFAYDIGVTLSAIYTGVTGVDTVVNTILSTLESDLSSVKSTVESLKNADLSTLESDLSSLLSDLASIDTKIDGIQLMSVDLGEVVGKVDLIQSSLGSLSLSVPTVDYSGRFDSLDSSLDFVSGLACSIASLSFSSEEKVSLLKKESEDLSSFSDFAASFLSLVNSSVPEGESGLAIPDPASLLLLLGTLAGNGVNYLDFFIDLIDLLLKIKDKFDDRVTDKPDSLLFDGGKHWNRIIGSALNYGCDESNRVVELIPDTIPPVSNDWYFDFKKLFKFRSADDKLDLYLSEELKYLLYMNFSRTRE